MKLQDFMRPFGKAEKFKIIRNELTIGTLEGYRNTSDGKRFIHFFPNADIQPEDWVFSESTNEKFYIDDVIVSKDIDDNSNFSKDAYYLTESQHKKQSNSSSSVTFHISDVQNSIIGSQQNATLTNNFSDKQITDYIDKNCGPDKELMTEMLSMVNAVIENNVPVQKGTFSRFSETASKYGWLLGAVTTKLLAHFF
ncbi:hypothetical protein ABEW24_23800 [Paenibacillus jamilae]|uniref:hypothetical protein n=1 Tax=Paenibacillus TaxID=44249 RepID=UPI00077CB5F2|nr:hypothetical protein [Paenibacillus polymyxa]KYG95676.1 hypothetical protein AZE31_18020 [Paenibacillus polymyxa]